MVVCGAVVRGAAVAEVVMGGDVVIFGDAVVAVAGALTTGCSGAAWRTGGGGITVGGEVAIAGCGGVVGWADLLSTLVGGSLDSEAESSVLTPKNDASTTASTPAIAAMCNSR